MGAAQAAVTAIDTSKTLDCVFITTHFHMGIGRMRQIAAKVIKPTEAEGLVREAFLDQPTLVTTAKASEIRHQKRLIDSPELDEIRSQDGYLTRHLASRSCTYNKATRFLPKSEAAAMYRTCSAYQKIRRPKLVAAFMAEYRKLEAVNFAPLAEALGDQFDRGDYPDSKTVEAGFYFEFNLRPVGDISLSGLPDFIIEEELAKDKEKREQAVIEWKDTLRAAGMEVVDALFEALRPEPLDNGRKRSVKDATVGNLQEFLATFNLRDLAGDTEYQKKVVEPLQQILKGVSAEKIRHSDNLKSHIAEQIAEIRKTASVLVQVTGRKFR